MCVIVGLFHVCPRVCVCTSTRSGKRETARLKNENLLILLTHLIARARSTGINHTVRYFIPSHIVHTDRCALVHCMNLHHWKIYAVS